MNPFILLGIAILAAVAAQLLIKTGVPYLGELELSLPGFFRLVWGVLKNVYILLGLFLLGISFSFYLFVISKKQLNIVYPISASLSILLVTALSWFLLKEHLSPIQVVGVGAIILGVFLLVK